MSDAKRLCIQDAKQQNTISLTTLPPDVIATIAKHLPLRAILALSQTAKPFRFLVLEDSILTSDLWSVVLRKKFPQWAFVLSNFTTISPRQLYRAMHRSKFSAGNVAWYDKKNKERVALTDAAAARFKESNGINEFHILYLNHVNQRTRSIAVQYRRDINSPFGRVVSFRESTRMQLEGTQRVRIPGVYRIIWRVRLDPHYQQKEPIQFTALVLPPGKTTPFNPRLRDVITDDEPEFEPDIIDEAVAMMQLQNGPQCCRYNWHIAPKTGDEYRAWMHTRAHIREQIEKFIEQFDLPRQKLNMCTLVHRLNQVQQQQQQQLAALVGPPPQAQVQLGNAAAVAAAAAAHPGPQQAQQQPQQVQQPQHNFDAISLYRNLSRYEAGLFLESELPPIEEWFEIHVGRIYVPYGNQYVYLQLCEPSADWSYGLEVDYVQLVPEFEDPSLVELPLLSSYDEINI